MTRKNHRKSKQSTSRFNALLSGAKALLATAALAGLSVFGLLRCFDGEGGSPLDPPVEEPPAVVRQVDVGDGKVADPTLVNEETLLKEETPPPPEVDSSAAPVIDTDVDTDSDTEAPAEPPEKQFPLYAVAFHFHTQFKAEPTHDSRVIGYARRGAVFRVSEVISTDGCRAGWHEISPGGLFACANQGIIVDDEPVSFAPSPPAPDLERPLPYRYAYVTAEDTPQYWRVPTPEEAAEVSTLFEKLRSKASDAAREGAVSTESAAAWEVSGDTDAAADSDAPTPTAPSTPEDTEGAAPEDTAGTDSESDTATPEDALPDYLYMRMAKGYYVSLDESVEDADRTFQRTVRGRVIPAERLAPAKPSDFEGFLIGDPAMLPQVIVVGSGVTALRQKVSGGPLDTSTKLAHLSRYDYLGEIQRNRRTYYQIGDGLFVSSRASSVVRLQEAPKNLKPGERWIDVDLSEQVLTAYEGERPVFATVVSTGRAGFETPVGEFRIYAKHMTVTMDDTEAGAEAYSIEDVPWVQYFKDSYALHGAFWHGRFGRVRSHGCVNLSPKDAKRLFAWTGPTLHDGIHGRFAVRDNPGTRVRIHE